MCRESASRVELPGEKRRWGGAWAWALGTPHRTCNYRPYNSTVLLGSILYSGPKHATHTNLLSSLRLSLFSSHSFKPIGASMPLSRSIHDLFGSRISVQDIGSGIAISATPKTHTPVTVVALRDEWLQAGRGQGPSRAWNLGRSLREWGFPCSDSAWFDAG